MKSTAVTHRGSHFITEGKNQVGQAWFTWGKPKLAVPSHFIVLCAFGLPQPTKHDRKQPLKDIGWLPQHSQTHPIQLHGFVYVHSTQVVPNSILFCYKQQIPHPNSTTRHRDQGQLTADFAYEDSAFSVPFISGCLSLPSTANVPAEAHLVILHVLERFQTQMSFALHNSIPKSPQNAFILLLGSLSSLPRPRQFLFEFELSWELPFQPSWPPATPVAFPVCRNGPFLCFQEVFLDDQSGLLGAFVLQNCLLQCTINQLHEQAKARTFTLLLAFLSSLSILNLSTAW